MTEIAELTIPVSNYGAFHKKVMILNKRASKLGLDLIRLTETGREFSTKYIKEDGKDVPVKVECIKITLTGDVPVIKGWRIIAAIDHLDGVNIVRSFVDLGKEYQEREPHCDHCGTKRIKKYSVVIKNVESGETMVVGKGCLKDFVETSTERELAYYNSLHELVESDFDSFGKTDYRYDVKEVLAIAVMFVDQDGFVPTSAESEGGFSTKSAILDYMFGRSRFSDEVRGSRPITEAHYAQASEVIKFIEGTSESSDFFSNLKALVKLEAVDVKYFGYLAGAVSAYYKSLTKKVERETEKLLNEYRAEPTGTRIKSEVKVKFASTCEGYYGTSYIYSFLDSEGRTLSTFSTRTLQLQTGDEVLLTGTIKKFQEYKGTKQTVLTRVKVD